MRAMLTIVGLMTGLALGAAQAADSSSVDADGVVTIRLGEAFEIVFPDRNDLGHPQFARVLDHIDGNVPGYHPDPNAPEPTGPAHMSFEFTNDGGMLMLHIRNDTGLTIKYDAMMVINGRPIRTSICPIYPGILGFEQWMDPIESLKLSGFRKADPGRMVCD